MDNRELYQILVEKKGYDLVLELIPEDLDSNIENGKLAIGALTWALKKNPHKSNNFLANFNWEECDDFSKAAALEAKLYINHAAKISLDKQKDIADEVLSLNPKAVYARIFIFQYYLMLGNKEEGINIMLEILNYYPIANWVYYVLSRYLVICRHYKDAVKYIPEIDSKLVSVTLFL